MNSENEKLFKDAEESADDEAFNDHEFNLAIKEDATYNNQINNMITDIYKANTPPKSSLKVVSMFDDKSKLTQEEFDNRKRVKFEQAHTELSKKRKQAPGADVNSPPKQSRSSPGKDRLDLIRSQINFESFACDQEIKEDIFRRIYYILSPGDFLSNGKVPPRGFLLHGPPGCGKTQLVYAIAGELNLPLLKVTSTELISGR